jgi:hypothetical protein
MLATVALTFSFLSLPALRSADGPVQQACSVHVQDPWILRVQASDGSWRGDSHVGPVGVTGLLVLGLLGDGHTTQSEAFRERVTRASDWLLAQQHRASGCFGVSSREELREERALLDHAWATLAISELLVLGKRLPVHEGALRAAIEALLSAQSEDGSFGTVRATGWAVLALVSARDSGCTVELDALLRGRTSIRQLVEVAGDPTHLDIGKVGLRFLVETYVAAGPNDEDRAKDTRAALERIVDMPMFDEVFWSTLDPESSTLLTFACYQAGGKVWASASKAFEALGPATGRLGEQGDRC